jgi:hypothetical protein
LADLTGLTTELSKAMMRRSFAPIHDRGRVLVDIAVMLADGGEAIADIDVLRHQEGAFGPVASPPTVWPHVGGPAASAGAFGHDQVDDFGVTQRPPRWLAVAGLVVGGRGDLDAVLVQHATDRLDPEHLLVVVDEIDQYREGRRAPPRRKPRPTSKSRSPAAARRSLLEGRDVECSVRVPDRRTHDECPNRSGRILTSAGTVLPLPNRSMPAPPAPS